MLLVPGITAGTGTEFEETLVRGGSVGLSQSEGAHEMAVSVDGALFRVPGYLGVADPRSTLRRYTGRYDAGNQ